MPDARAERVARAQDRYEAGDLTAAEAALEGIAFGFDEYVGATYATFCLVQGSIFAETGRLLAAEKAFDRAAGAYAALNDATGSALALFNQGNVLRYSGAERLAREKFRAALPLFEQTKQTGMALNMLLSIANACGAPEDRAEFDAAMAEFARLAPDETVLNPVTRWSLAFARGTRAECDGEFDTALAEIGTALTQAQASGIPGYVGEALLALGSLHLRQNHPDLARPLLDEAETLLRTSGDRRADDAAMLLRRIRAAVAAPAVPLRPVAAKPIGSVFVAEGADTADKVSAALGTQLPDATVIGVVLGYSTVFSLVSGPPGLHLLDAATMPPTGLMDVLGTGPDREAAARGLAAALSRAGVEARERGEHRRAVDAYGVCLQLALLLRDSQGLEVLSGNLLVAERSLSALGKGAIIALGPPPPDLAATLARVREIASGLEPAIESCAEVWSAAKDDGALLECLMAAHRLLLLGEPDIGLDQRLLPFWAGGGVLGERQDDRMLRRRSRLREIVRLAERVGRPELALTAAYAELGFATLSELLATVGVDVTPGPHVRAALGVEQKDQSSGIDLVLALWRELREAKLAPVDKPMILQFCDLAVYRLNLLRVMTVMGGTWSSHMASYRLAQITARAGRDLVRLQLAVGADLAALEAYEAVRSRALADWMGRTHFLTSLVARRDLIGSIGEVLPESLDGIVDAARANDAVILAFFIDDDVLHAWLVTQDGGVAHQSMPFSPTSLTELLSELPYGASTEEIVRGGALDAFFLQVDEPASLAPALDRLSAALLHERIAASLAQATSCRLVIIPDGVLDLVPFCCLRVGGQFLVEHFELSYWPSVAAWRLCQGSMDARHERPAVVLGDPAFASGGDSAAALKRLPASGDEAREVAQRLQTSAMTEDAATRENIVVACGGRNGVPVLHLATHGILDMNQPEQSHLALAGAGLDVDFLFRYDPGLRCGLVVLSACQTALGRQHPDSLIGLANAFLIAGACAVLSSLWKVPDGPTRDLMTRFYDRLLADDQATLAAVLASVQREMLAAPSTAHPFYWAAFRLSGANLHPCRHLCVAQAAASPATAWASAAAPASPAGI